MQPLFRGGELQARRRSAVAAYEQAGAAYQEAVLQGLQNVADVLRALEADAARLKERADAAERARRYRDIIARAADQAGGVSQAAMLEATRQLPSRAARADAGRRRSLCRLCRAAAGARRRLVAGGEVAVATSDRWPLQSEGARDQAILEDSLEV